MPTVEELFNDPAYQRPGQAKASGGQTVEDLFNDPAYQRPAPTQATTTATTTAAGADPGVMNWLENNVFSPARYVGGRFVAGALHRGQAMAQAEIGSQSGGTETMPTTDDKKNELIPKLTGTDRPAPNDFSRYAGTLAEAFGADPMSAIAAPEASVAGGLAAQGAEDLGFGKWASLGAGLLFGTGASGVRGALALAAKNRGLAAAEQAARDRYTTVDNDLTRAQDDLVRTRLTKRRDIKDVADASKSVRDLAIEKANQDLAAANATADANLLAQAKISGKSDSFQSTGNFVQDKVRDWVADKFPTAKMAAVKPINDMVAGVPEMVVGRDNFANALKQITESGGSNQALIDALRPSLPARLLRVFKAGAGEDAPAEGMLGEPIPKSIEATPQDWEDASRLRTAIGDAMSNPRIVSDFPASQLKQLYAAQHADMRAALIENADALRSNSKAMGIEPIDAFDRANEELSRLYGIAENQMGKIVHGPKPTGSDPKAEDVAAKLLSDAQRGGTDLQVLRQEVPEAADELAGLHLRMNPADWKGMSPEAKTALVPDVNRQHIIDLALATKEGAKDTRQTAVAAAKTAHRGEIETARDAVQTKIEGKEGNINELNRQVREGKAALDEAVKALPPVTEKLSLRDITHALMHSPGAVGMGALVYQLAPEMSHPMRAIIATGSGLAVPFAARGLVGAAKRPASIAAGLQAGAAGGNELNTPVTGPQ